MVYLSDPNGKLKIITKNELAIRKQGSNQAEFLECSHCNNVIAVVYKVECKSKGAVNATLLVDYNKMIPAEVVSPKLLSAEEKAKRWLNLWLEVSISAI